ncbi:PH protein [Mesorhizobium loti]|nr:PH protein [Mesorhizobium loti]
MVRPTTQRGLASCTLTPTPDQAVTQPAPPKASASAATAMEEVSAREREHAAQATQESLISCSCDKLRLNVLLEKPAKTAPEPKPAISVP